MLAIIGGSGFAQLSILEDVHRQVVRTPYGEPSGALILAKLYDQDVVFLPRHGYGHTLAPHHINYRANIWALKEVGASAVLSLASVGGIHKDFVPGSLVVPHQLIDYTWGRISSFFAEESSAITHTDFTTPYDETLRLSILSAANQVQEKVFDFGVYAVTQGPRLETAAEIIRYERDGADLVGMTSMPEALLAREIGLAYAPLCIVANYAAGKADSAKLVNLDSIQLILKSTYPKILNILAKFCSKKS